MSRSEETGPYENATGIVKERASSIQKGDQNIERYATVSPSVAARLSSGAMDVLQRCDMEIHQGPPLEPLQSKLNPDEHHQLINHIQSQALQRHVDLVRLVAWDYILKACNVSVTLL